MLDDIVSAEAVAHFCRIANHRLGVGIDASQHALVAGRVAKRLRTLQIDLDEYIGRLDDDHTCGEVVGFLDFLRPQPAHFFARRDDHVALHAHLVRRFREGKWRIRLWSAGCGTGEEAYGMALTALGAIEESRLDLRDVDLKILATDISKPILERGKQGVFHEAQLRDVPRALCSRYFRPTEQGWAIDEDIKDMVLFRRLNLTALPYPMTGPLEAIFCHDGLALLARSARGRAVAAVRKLLAEQGLLCTGFADEALADAGEDADLVAAGSLRKAPHGHC
jgi:chemotaxis protein methyltransferase CheR